MELNEGGKTFVEKIKVDTEANTEEYSVPQHGKRVAIDVLKDFTKVSFLHVLNLACMYV